MSQKVIRTILFIFFLFLFNLVIAEETKVKLVKVKEFSSYEEYEKWKGVVKKPPRIKIEGDTIKFFDEKGEVIKEKKFNKYDEQKAKQIREKLQDETAEIEFETPEIIPNETGMIITKRSSFGYKGVAIRKYDILDKDGNLTGEIKDNVTLYIPPNGKYFIGCESDESGLYGDIKFYDKDGNLFARYTKVFDFEGPETVIFSNDSKYVLISINGEHKDGFIIFTNEGKIVLKKEGKGWWISSKNSVEFLENDQGIILGTFKGVFRFSIDGKEIWHYQTNGPARVISISTDKNDIAIYVNRKISPETVHLSPIICILNTKTGKLIREISLPDNIAYKYISGNGKVLVNRQDYLLIKNSGAFNYDGPYTKTMYIIDKNQGDIIWKKENVDLSVDAELTENEELLLKEEQKITLYKVYKVRQK